MSKEEMINMLLELINNDNGEVTKNYKNRNELQLFLLKLKEIIL